MFPTQPTNHVSIAPTPHANLFTGNAQQRLFALTVNMLGNPTVQTIQGFFQHQVPQIVALLRSKPALMKDLAATCEKFPEPYGALTGIACGANALPEALSGLRNLSPEQEEVALASLRRIYAFNPQAGSSLIAKFGTQGSLKHRIRVLELVLTSQAGNRNSMNHILEGIVQNSSQEDLNSWISARLLALSSRPQQTDRKLAFKQGWLTTWVKGWLGEERDAGRMSPSLAVIYDQRFNPRG